MNLQKDIDDFEKQINHLKALGAETYSFDRMANIVKSLLKTSPHQVGDKVRLTKTPEISDKVRWGWLGAKHFLVEGALAEVAAVDWNCERGCYTYALLFENDSWIDQTGITYYREQKDKGHYYFGISWIEGVR